MNLIIVAGFFKAPKKISLPESQFLALGGAFVAVLLGVGAFVGYGVHGWFGDAGGTQVAALQQQITAQRAEAEVMRDATQRDLNAMAVKLAELQAQSTRINALGERLTQLAGLADGEFDFSAEPAVGGPVEGGTAVAPTGADLGISIDTLTGQLSIQTEQLALLESLLSNQELDASLLPTGSPVRSGYASSSFGARSDPFSGYNSFHTGVDFAGPRGSDILAVADGVVQFSGTRSGYGKTIEIDHGNGYMTRYAHNSSNVVAEGERVKAGQVIGKIGSTGRSTGSHVHFEVWLNGKVVNPRQYLSRARG